MELTQAQKDAFPPFLDRWMRHGLSTQPADRPTAERGIRLAYEAAGLPAPENILWLGSPLAGALLDTLFSRITSPEPKQVSREKQDYSPAVNKIVDELHGLVQELQHLTKTKLTRELLVDCLSNLQLHNAAYGQHDASILCFYDFFAQVCGVDECKKLEGLNLVSQSAGWWWAYDNLAVLTERPTHLALDERGRLHADSDWAIRYPDGFGYCLVHGVEVPEHVVLEPSKITTSEIDATANVEVRRVMIEKYGLGRYLLDSGAVEIQRDDWGILYRKEQPEDEPLVMVKVVNSTPEPDGSFRDYMIRVPPDSTTAQGAVAWTFAQGIETYAPEVQT